MKNATHIIMSINYKMKKELEDAIIVIDLQKAEIKNQIQRRKEAKYKWFWIGFITCISCIYIMKAISLLINLIF